MGRRKTAKHAQRGTGFDPEVLSLCRPTRGGGLSDCERNWKVGGGWVSLGQGSADWRTGEFARDDSF